MNGKILTLFAETNVHVGSGQSTSSVDLPVFREKITDYPIIPSSSLKGALRAKGRKIKIDEEELNRMFGKQDAVGKMLISDARLLLLPVRSLTSNYKWVTCKYVLERVIRDISRAKEYHIIENPKAIQETFEQMNIEEGRFLSDVDEENIFLEEREFQLSSKIPDDIINILKKFIPFTISADRLEKQLVILSDTDFKWFANYSLSVVARNQLHEETKTSENLWYEEAVNPDTIFYTLLGSYDDGFNDLIESRYLQIGGNESIGHGWFLIKLI